MSAIHPGQKVAIQHLMVAVPADMDRQRVAEYLAERLNTNGKLTGDGVILDWDYQGGPRTVVTIPVETTARELEFIDLFQLEGEAEPDEPTAQERIFEHYETDDINDIYLAAAEKRSWTRHEETVLPGGDSFCHTCGKLKQGHGDPVFHPEQYL